MQDGDHITKHNQSNDEKIALSEEEEKKQRISKLKQESA